jgi:hypothetical protein
MRSLGDFTKASSGAVLVCFHSDTIADRGTSCVQLNDGEEVRTFRGHGCGLSHGHGQRLEECLESSVRFVIREAMFSSKLA